MQHIDVEETIIIFRRNMFTGMLQTGMHALACYFEFSDHPMILKSTKCAAIVQTATFQLQTSTQTLCNAGSTYYRRQLIKYDYALSVRPHPMTRPLLIASV